MPQSPATAQPAADTEYLEPLHTEIPGPIGDRLRFTKARDRRTIREIVSSALDQLLPSAEELGVPARSNGAAR